MVWAAEFVAARRDGKDPGLASFKADQAVVALRFGGVGDNWREMVGKEDEGETP